MKTYPLIDKTAKPKKLRIAEYKTLRAAAFAQGAGGYSEAQFEFDFEIEAYQLGVSQTERLRGEIAAGGR